MYEENTVSRENTMPGYMTYREAALMFSLMPEEDAARAIKATVNYFLYGVITDLDGTAAEVFKIMCSSIDRGRLTYKAQCEGGKHGADKRYGKTQGK